MSSAESSTNDDFDARFFDGADAYREDKFEEGLEIFLDLLEDYPNSVGALMFIGSIYHELGRLDLAIDYASEATYLSPISEKSSFILHNALRESGLRREAYEEMERYFNTPGAQPTTPLYDGYLYDLAQDLELSYNQNTDKTVLVRAVIEGLEDLGFLENEVE